MCTMGIMSSLMLEFVVEDCVHMLACACVNVKMRALERVDGEKSNLALYSV